MYCTNCGRQIESGTICPECAQTIANRNTYSEYANHTPYNAEYGQPKNTGSRMLGFGKALTSTILSTVGFIFAYIAFIAILSARLSPLGSAAASGAAFGVLTVFSLPMHIISLVFGISSIKLFRTATPKPIATLVLGINGLEMSALSLLLVFLELVLASI